jgi:hypothetical protein
MKNFLKVLVLALLLQVPILAFAQPEFEDDVDDVPVDGGISVLLIAGVAYGAKKMHDFKQKNK